MNPEKAAPDLQSMTGFTVFELVFVLLLFSVLWLVQLSAFDSIRLEFRRSLEKNIVSSIQIGLLSYFIDPHRGNVKNYPLTLDNQEPGDCSQSKPCFENVLGGGITLFWKKTTPLEYLGPADKRHVWKYNPPAGEFYLLNDPRRL